MIDLFLLAVMTSLIIFGVTFTVVYLDGPGDIIKRTRKRLQYRQHPVYDERQIVVNIIEKQRRFFFGVLDCFWCFSLWVAVVVNLYWLLTGYPIGDVIIVFLTSYGLCGFIHEIIANG